MSFGHHGPPSALGLLLIHGCWVFGAVICVFGVWCLIKGVKEWFK